MYNKIYNFPEERSKIIYPYCFSDGAFSDSELESMCQYFSNNGTENATIVDDNKPIDMKMRRSRIKFYHRDEYTYSIFDRLNNVIENLNDRFYNFDLNGYEAFQYTEYLDTDSGTYDFHLDTIFGKNGHHTDYEMRKLSLIMCLNEPGKDFEGGQFYLNMGKEEKALEVEMKKGRIILFPSFLLHRVAPVTKGIRKSLVIWVTGPKFR